MLGINGGFGCRIDTELFVTWRGMLGLWGILTPAALLVPGTLTQRWQQGTELLGQQQLPEELA